MAASRTKQKTLMVVEDDPGLQGQLRWCFDDYEVLVAGDRASALDLLSHHQPPVVTLDLGLPPDAAGTSEGLAALKQIHVKAPDTKVIVVTGNDDRENAVRAVGMGAFDFYHKPIDPEILGLIVNRAYRVHELEMENRRLSEQQTGAPLDGVISCSPGMLDVCRTVEKVAPADATALLLGESGTGKELIARALHALSARKDGPFIAINCAAIPETLLESELFGYEKGAFTGAAKQTAGKIEGADQGTLFLDEVGDLPMSLQAKLLRFLQERVVEHLGGRQEIPVDVRVVCATHRDLAALIAAQEFREDLYYRISEIAIRIPPLRDRAGDVLMLARHFLERFARQEGRVLAGFSEDALSALEVYPWPGNVRELKNRIKRAVIMADGKYLSARDLELGAPDGAAASFKLREVREHAERQAVLRALGHVSGKISEAAELLGVSRPTLYDMIRKFRLKV
ncbi:MAG: PEP-CTERM-box response regulator transcription factor [Chromatiales bacterium 21-64-14]|nr:MAG: PEP-CTERM-box response regulator transcription factor [Chromatiales bacterium 21-64-14]HQU15304.1 PEP-CTERM-box response regulator transcription factor [Gammaproteobacteria bacterium]